MDLIQQVLSIIFNPIEGATLTNKAVWFATHKLAELWRSSDLIQRFTAQLPSNNSATNGVPEMLRNINASTGLVSSQPLIPNTWEDFAQQLPLVTLDVVGVDFLDAAQPIGFAAENQTAWLRSRLPGYPMILAPHLARGTHRTAPEVGRDLAWRREALQGGLQFDPNPRGISQLLSIGELPYNRAIHAVLNALQETKEWTEFSTYSMDLTEGSRRELAEARKRLHTLLSREAIDEYEPERMARREDYRRRQVATVVNDLSDSAREYARAFERVDELIDWVSLRVLGQFVAYGPPQFLTDAKEVERERGTIRFQSHTPFPQSSLVQINHPLAPDLALVTSMNFYSNERGAAVNKYSAEILAGSAGLFTPEPRPA